MTATSPVTHPRPHPTHEVFNQPEPRVNVNEYDLNPVLAEAVTRHDAG